MRAWGMNAVRLLLNIYIDIIRRHRIKCNKNVSMHLSEALLMWNAGGQMQRLCATIGCDFLKCTCPRFVPRETRSRVGMGLDEK